MLLMNLVVVLQYICAVTSLMQCQNVVMKCVLFHVMKEQGRNFKSVVLLQICMGLIKDEPDSGSEACVTTLNDGSEEFSTGVEAEMKVEEADIKVYETEIKVEESDIKIEDAIDIKEENPEANKFPSIKTEPEVSVWGLCVRQQQFMLHRPFTASK